MVIESNTKQSDFFKKLLKTGDSNSCLKCGFDNEDMLSSYYVSRGLTLKYLKRKDGDFKGEYEHKNNFDIINACFCDSCLDHNYKNYIKKQKDDYSTDLMIGISGLIFAPLAFYLFSTSDGPIFGETVAGSGQGMSAIFGIFALLLALYSAFTPYFLWRYIRAKNTLKKGNPITKVSDKKNAYARIISNGNDLNISYLPEFLPSWEMAKISHKKHLKKVKDEQSFLEKLKAPEYEWLRGYDSEWSFSIEVLSVSSIIHDTIPCEWMKLLKNLTGARTIPISKGKKILYFISRDWLLIPIIILSIIAIAYYIMVFA